MQSKILKLVRRSQSIELGDISRFLEAEIESLTAPLSNLIADGKIEKDGECYRYVNTEQRACLNESGKPDMYQLADKNTIYQIISSFCIEITSNQAAFLLNPRRNNVDKFYKHFRDEIYNKQKKELQYYFKLNPKVGRERVYKNKTVYLYLYNNNLYVSDSMLMADYLSDVTQEERMKIKNLYKRSYNKNDNHVRAKNYHIFISEEVWRLDKSWETLFYELCEILSPYIK